MPDRLNPSLAYQAALEAAAAHHASSKTYSGKFLRPHKPFLSAIIRREGIASILDYGAGKGAQYEWVDPEDGKTLEEAWGVPVYKFDPAWPPFAAEPEPGRKFDMVICTHTLPTIPLMDLPWVLRELGDRANKVVYVAEKLGEPRKRHIPDPSGRAVGWDSEAWLRALKTNRRPGVIYYLSTRVRHPDNTAQTRRWKLAAEADEWALVFDTEAGDDIAEEEEEETVQ